MIRQDRRAGSAAAAIALLSILMVAVGMLLVGMLGGTTGRDLGGAAADSDFARAVPLILAAEVLKLATAAAQLVVVAAAARGEPSRAPRLALLALGGAGALLVAASGLAGLLAVAAERHSPLIADFGFAGMAATGLWALLLVGLELPRLRRWHSAAGILFGAASLAALAAPPAAFLSVLAGLAWWFGLAGRLRGG